MALNVSSTGKCRSKAKLDFRLFVLYQCVHVNMIPLLTLTLSTFHFMPPYFPAAFSHNFKPLNFGICGTTGSDCVLTARINRGGMAEKSFKKKKKKKNIRRISKLACIPSESIRWFHNLKPGTHWRIIGMMQTYLDIWEATIWSSVGTDAHPSVSKRNKKFSDSITTAETEPQTDLSRFDRIRHVWFFFFTAQV